MVTRPILFWRHCTSHCAGCSPVGGRGKGSSKRTWCQLYTCFRAVILIGLLPMSLAIALKWNVLLNIATSSNFVWDSENWLCRRSTWSSKFSVVKVWQKFLFWDGFATGPRVSDQHIWKDLYSSSLAWHCSENHDRLELTSP